MISEVLLTIIGVLSFVYIIWKTYKRRNYPPGPLPWPIIGNIYLLRRLTLDFGGQHLAFLELSQRYKSDVISLKLGVNNVVVISGQEGIQTVLKSEDFDGRPWDEFVKLRNMGLRKGITMSDGPEWKEIRGWFVRRFRDLGFGRALMFDLIRDELIDILSEVKEGGIRYMTPITISAVINVLWTLTTGKRISNDKRMKLFLDLMERRSKAFSMGGGVLSSIPWIRYIAPEASGYNLLMTLNKELKDFLMEIIEDHKNNHVAGDESDFINMFLEEMYYGKGRSAGFTEDQLVLILLDIFIAGTLTTAATLDFLFLNTLIHPYIQKRLHEELDNVVGRKRLPEIADKQKLPYLEAVLTESQRLYAVTPVIGPRRVLRDTKLLGYNIPKDTSILINIYSSNTSEIRYENSKSFLPERFIENESFHFDDKLILFGQGRRRCPGEILARSAIFLLFSGILQRFELRPVHEQQIPSLKIVPGLIISPQSYQVLLVPRE